MTLSFSQRRPRLAKGSQMYFGIALEERSIYVELTPVKHARHRGSPELVISSQILKPSFCLRHKAMAQTHRRLQTAASRHAAETSLAPPRAVYQHASLNFPKKGPVASELLGLCFELNHTPLWPVTTSRGEPKWSADAHNWSTLPSCRARFVHQGKRHTPEKSAKPPNIWKEQTDTLLPVIKLTWHPDLISDYQTNIIAL